MEERITSVEREESRISPLEVDWAPVHDINSRFARERCILALTNERIWVQQHPHSNEHPYHLDLGF